MNENDVLIKDDITDENPDLLKPLEPDSEMKEWLINYVGEREQPENGEVNVEMILKSMSEEFPEFLLPLAEENFIRGYQQALTDIEGGRKMWEEKMEKNQEQNEQ
tara:strand:+ start:5721 stop:6035 length:315 start_codon:yes stop_codon:yes gene_type:complete